MKSYKVVLLGFIVALVSKIVALEENAVGVTTLNFFDKKSGKSLIAKIWYPASQKDKRECEYCEFGRDVWQYKQEAYNVPVLLKDNKKMPLVVWSHGFGGDRFNNSWFAHALAQHGYVVAALDHHRANMYRDMDPYYFSRPWNRPQEVSFLITSLLNNPEFKNFIDPDKIAVAGFSQGGATALWLAGAQTDFTNFVTELSWAYDWVHKLAAPETLDEALSVVPNREKDDYIQANASYRDPRVKAVIALSPGLGRDTVFTDQSLENITIPVLIISGNADDIVPLELNAQRFAALIPGAQLVVLKDAGHWTMLNSCSDFGIKLLPEMFCSNPKTIDHEKIHKIIEDKASNFLDSVFSII